MCWHGGAGYVHSGIPEPSAIQKPDKKKYFKDVTQLGRRLLIMERRVSDMKALFLGNVIEWQAERLPMWRERYRGCPSVETLARNPDPFVEFSDAVAALLKFVRGANVDILVMGQPVLWNPEMTEEEKNALWFYVSVPTGCARPSPAWLEGEISRYNAEQERLAGLHGAGYIDLDKKIPKSLRYFYDDCHFTDSGSRQVAESILPVVRDRVIEILQGRKKAEAL